LAKPLIEKLDAKLLEEDKEIDEKRKRGLHIEKLGFFASVI
jgi:exosome complex component RRP42